MRSSRSFVYTAPASSPTCSTASRSASASSSGGSSSSACSCARRSAASASVTCARHAPQQHVGPPRLFAAEPLGLLLDRVGGVLPAGGVDEFDLHAGEVEPVGEVVAGGAGAGADQRRQGAGQRVEQAALADVRVP